MQLRRYSLFQGAKRDDIELYPVIIEINRLVSDISKNACCEGVCTINQYDTFLYENIAMPSDIAFSLMENLNIMYLNSRGFMEKGISIMDSFIEENMFNEFDQALWRYNELEPLEREYLCSPLAIEYLLVKLAYHSVNSRDVYNRTLLLLKSVLHLMDRNQKFLYYLYLGIDAFKIQHDSAEARRMLDKARVHGGHPHVYAWIGITELYRSNAIAAVKMFEKAQRRYTNDGNLIGLIFATELMGLAYYMENDYDSGIDVFEGALGYSKALERKSLESNFKNQIAWGYFRMHEYDKALGTLVKDRYNNDLTVNSSVTKFLIAYHLGDESLMEDLKIEFANRNKTLHRMISSVIAKDPIIDDEGEVMINADELISLVELAAITHFELKKEFDEILMSYYMKNKDYEAACVLLKEKISKTY